METFDQLINARKPVLVDFYAEWCGPCKAMKPVLDEVKSEVGDRAVIVKVDVDRNRPAASLYGVNSVPTLMIFKGGKAVWKRSGVVPARELVLTLRHFYE